MLQRNHIFVILSLELQKGIPQSASPAMCRKLLWGLTVLVWDEPACFITFRRMLWLKYLKWDKALISLIFIQREKYGERETERDIYIYYIYILYIIIYNIFTLLLTVMHIEEENCWVKSLWPPSIPSSQTTTVSSSEMNRNDGFLEFHDISCKSSSICLF